MFNTFVRRGHAVGPRCSRHVFEYNVRTKVAGSFNILSGLLEDDAGSGGFHLEDLEGIVDAFCRVVQDQA